MKLILTILSIMTILAVYSQKQELDLIESNDTLILIRYDKLDFNDSCFINSKQIIIDRKENQTVYTLFKQTGSQTDVYLCHNPYDYWEGKFISHSEPFILNEETKSVYKIDLSKIKDGKYYLVYQSCNLFDQFLITLTTFK